MCLWNMLVNFDRISKPCDSDYTASIFKVKVYSDAPASHSIATEGNPDNRETFKQTMKKMLRQKQKKHPLDVAKIQFNCK